jgi:hypothetical protein
MLWNAINGRGKFFRLALMEGFFHSGALVAFISVKGWEWMGSLYAKTVPFSTVNPAKEPKLEESATHQVQTIIGQKP